MVTFSIFFLILFLHLMILPTVICHHPIFDASSAIRSIITILIFIRLLIKPTDTDRLIYLTFLATDIIWVPALIILFFPQ